MPYLWESFSPLAASCGGLLRNSTDDLVYVFAKKMVCNSSFQVELYRVIKAIYMLVSLGGRKFGWKLIQLFSCLLRKIPLLCIGALILNG